MVDDPLLTPLLAAAAVAVLVLTAEAWHVVRIRRMLHLAFGPSRRPARWVRTVPLLRAGAAVALAWGACTLLLIEPMKHSSSDAMLKRNQDYRHVLLVLDVSPSMRLIDAGPNAPDAYAGQTFFPPGLEGRRYYHPVERGFEREIKRRLAYWQKLRRERSQ